MVIDFKMGGLWSTHKFQSRLFFFHILIIVLYCCLIGGKSATILHKLRDTSSCFYSFNFYLSQMIVRSGLFYSILFKFFPEKQFFRPLLKFDLLPCSSFCCYMHNSFGRRIRTKFLFSHLKKYFTIQTNIILKMLKF